MSSSEHAEWDAFRREVQGFGGQSVRLSQCCLLVLAGAVMGNCVWPTSGDWFVPAWTRFGAMLFVCALVVQRDLRMWSSVRRWMVRGAGEGPGCVGTEPAGKARTCSEGQ